MADFDAQSTNLDLNAATSAMFEDRKGHAMGSADIFGLPAATVMLMLIGGLAAIAAMLLSSKGLKEACSAVKALVAHFLILAFNPLSPPAAEGLKSGGKTSKQPRNPRIERKTFSMEARLEPCNLVEGRNKRRSSSFTLLENALSPAVLPKPQADRFIPTSGPLNGLEERIRRLEESLSREDSPHSMGMPEQNSEIFVFEQPGQGRRSFGAKPDVNRLRDRQLLQGSSSPEHSSDSEGDFQRARTPDSDALSTFSGESLYEEDSDWEDEPRAEMPASGDMMDGEDVGCPPLRTLALPHSRLAYTAIPVYGRSVFTSDWKMPTAQEQLEERKAAAPEMGSPRAGHALEEESRQNYLNKILAASRAKNKALRLKESNGKKDGDTAFNNEPAEAPVQEPDATAASGKGRPVKDLPAKPKETQRKKRPQKTSNKN